MAEKKWSSKLTHRVGLQIAERRKAQGISARELSERTASLGEEIPQQVITNIENGRRDGISIAELILIGTALDVAPLELVFPGDLAGVPTAYLPGAMTYNFSAREGFAGLSDLDNHYGQVRDLLKLEGGLRQQVLDLIEEPPSDVIVAPLLRAVWNLGQGTAALRRALRSADVVLAPAGGMVDAIQSLPDTEYLAVTQLASLIDVWRAEG